jgi:NhaP-type Na+/H+ and K+/H+ antiporter
MAEKMEPAMGPIITLLIVLFISLLLTRIATVALTHTGLSRESAKFQARSAFTGVGFTTTESEKVVNHPTRRRILLLLMLLGNAGVVTAVSALIVSFINLEQSGPLFWQILLLVTGILLIWALANSTWLDQRMSAWISRLLDSYTRISVQDYAGLLHLSGDYQITELQVTADDWIRGKALAQAGLRKEGIMVLGVTRENGTYLGAPDGDTEVRENDQLILYGRSSAIRELDQRRKGSSGDRKHMEKTREQRRIRRQEKAGDDNG